MERFDVIIVGAGLSGVGAARHLLRDCPGKTYVLLEARDAIGGTWDLFRYPGIRSDSDMFTLGYDFRPWPEQKAIADGPSILKYVNETAAEAGIDQHIRYHHKVVRSEFDSSTGLWTVHAQTPEGEVQLQCRLLLHASGYYSYDNPYNPQLPGEADFAGPLFHAQLWPQDLDYRGKRVAVIGSGATAVTIVPVVAREAAHVTMVQRSPTWMVSRPSVDAAANFLRRWLPAKIAYGLVRLRNVLWQAYFYKKARGKPKQVGRLLTDRLLEEMPPETVNAHFQPHYNVWDQRICLVPDSDLFTAVNDGSASIVTDQIDHLDAGGIVLKSGGRVDADIIVKATGLRMQALGGSHIAVDGAQVPVHDRYSYRGMMLEGVPNLVYVFGYFAYSWTLRADLTCRYACRLLNALDAHNAAIAVPERHVAVADEAPILTSGYVQRGIAAMPRQSSTDPWRDMQDYLRDRQSVNHDPLEDGVLKFRKARARPVATAEPLAMAAE